MDPRIEIAGGSALMAAPWWAAALQDVSLVTSTVAAVCGAVVGIHAVYRIWKRYH